MGRGKRRFKSILRGSFPEGETTPDVREVAIDCPFCSATHRPEFDFAKLRNVARRAGKTELEIFFTCPQTGAQGQFKTAVLNERDEEFWRIVAAV